MLVISKTISLIKLDLIEIAEMEALMAVVNLMILIIKEEKLSIKIIINSQWVNQIFQEILVLNK